jgi:WD40 repeat protein
VLEWSFAGNGEAVVTLDRDGRVVRWHGPDFQDRQPLLDLGTNTVGARFSKDGRRVAIGSTNGVVEVWDLEKRVRSRQLTVSTGPVRVLGFLAQGKGLVTMHLADTTGSVRSTVPFVGFSRLALLRPEAVSVHEWDLETGQETRNWRARWPSDTFAVAQSPDEHWLLALGFGGAIWLGDRLTGREAVHQLDIRAANEAAFTWDGKRVAAASWDGRVGVRVWDAATLREIAVAPAEGFSVAFTPDGQRLAIGLNGKRAITLWDMESQQEVLALEGEGSNFWRSEFSPDGNVLGSENMKGVLHLWRAPSWAEIDAAEKAGAPGPRR